MIIHRGTVTLTKYEIHRASLALRKRLQRKYPDVFIYGGINADEPYEIIVKSSRPIDCPTEFEWQGIVHPVIYEIRGEYEFRDSKDC